jgi:hypothetical protein
MLLAEEHEVVVRELQDLGEKATQGGLGSHMAHGRERGEQEHSVERRCRASASRLLHCDGLREIARLVNVAAHRKRGMIRQQLQRNIQ